MSFQNQHNLRDQQLVKEVLAESPGSFGIMIKSTERLVAQIVCKMINNAEDRKDIAQEIYLKAYKNLSGFKFEAKLTTWIAQIAYNTCLNHLAKKRIAFTDEIEIADGYLADEADKNFALKIRSDIINAAIDRLPGLLKTLVTLYHNEELSYFEIKQITSLPEGTIKSYLFRARKALKKDLLQHYKREEI